MLNWKELTQRQKIAGLFMLLICVVGLLAGAIAANKEAPISTALGAYAVMGLLGCACVVLGALLDPRSFKARPFQISPDERSPRIVMVLGVCGFFLLIASTILTRYG
jgi:hypothetical protein